MNGMLQSNLLEEPKATARSALKQEAEQQMLKKREEILVVRTRAHFRSSYFSTCSSLAGGVLYLVLL